MDGAAFPVKLVPYDNAANLSADIPTFAHYLSRSELQTAYRGKCILWFQINYLLEERDLLQIFIPADYGWFPNGTIFKTQPYLYHQYVISHFKRALSFAGNHSILTTEVVFHAQRIPITTM